MTEAEARRIASLTPVAVIEAAANIITLHSPTAEKSSKAPKR